MSTGSYDCHVSCCTQLLYLGSQIFVSIHTSIHISWFERCLTDVFHTVFLEKAGGLDKLTLDSLYDDALRRNNQNVSYNPWEPAPMAGPMMQQNGHDPFFASGMVAAPHSVQMAAMANQQQAFMLQQQQQAFMLQQQQQQMMMMAPQQSSNPFANPYVTNTRPYGSGMPVQAYNPYTGLM